MGDANTCRLGRLRGYEIDLLIKDGEKLFPVEIKSAQTISGGMLDGLNYWRKLDKSESGMLVYGGTENYTKSGIMIRSWASI